MQRTEQNYSGGWVNSARLTYQHNVQGWQAYEERFAWGGSSWNNQYDITQTYDACGNRTGFHRNVAGPQPSPLVFCSGGFPAADLSQRCQSDIPWRLALWQADRGAGRAVAPAIRRVTRKPLKRAHH